MIDEQKGATEAESLLEQLGFDSLPIIPIDIANAIHCDDFRLVMEYQDFNSDKILGKAEGNSKGALIYINKNIPDPGRINFTAAHEIGHVCMHIIPQRKFSFECGSQELSSSFDDPVEKQANGFASGLLIPKRLIKQNSNCDINWENIHAISQLCRTSLEATYRRLSFLERTPSALVIHKSGEFKRFVASQNFGFYIGRTHLTNEQKSLITDVSQNQYPADFDTTDASDWVNANSKSGTLETIFSSTILLKDGFTYTLLSYDDDCFEEEDEDC